MHLTPERSSCMLPHSGTHGWKSVAGVALTAAEGLHLIDFEQLKIENQSLNEKIEERNEELVKLRKKTTVTVQVSHPSAAIAVLAAVLCYSLLVLCQS